MAIVSIIHVETLAEVRGHGHGRLGRHIEHDERSRDYDVATAVKGTKLHAVAWDRHGGPLDQGATGSCTGQALAGLLNTDPFFRGTLQTEADALRLYGEATHLDHIAGSYPDKDTGSSGLAVCKAARRDGLITGYRHAFSLRSALQALMHGPVITGVDWTQGFDHPNAEGLVEIGGTVRGGHEFEVVSYDPASDLVGAWNSWGSGFGLAGRFYFTSATWRELLARRGDVTVPVPLAA